VSSARNLPTWLLRFELSFHVIDHHPCNINIRSRFDAFDSRRRIDFKNKWTAVGTQNIHTCHLKTKRFCCGSRCLDFFFSQSYLMNCSTAVQIRSKLTALRNAFHRGYHYIPYNQAPHITVICLFDELLYENVRLKLTKRVDN
jgi:hypothetical protein